jgi:hypothetical protein
MPLVTDLRITHFQEDANTYKGILICAGVLAVIVFSFIANKLDSLDDDDVRAFLF